MLVNIFGEKGGLFALGHPHHLEFIHMLACVHTGALNRRPHTHTHPFEPYIFVKLTHFLEIKVMHSPVIATPTKSAKAGNKLVATSDGNILVTVIPFN